MKSKEELKIYRKAYYLRNPKHWQEYARNYYHQHKEERKEYQLKNKEKTSEDDIHEHRPDIDEIRNPINNDRRL